MTKTIPTTLGILIILLVAGVAGASVLFFNQEIEEKVALEEETFFEEDEIVEEDEFVDWNTYRNEEHGFEISYPENLKEEEGDGHGTGFSLEAEGDVLLRIYVGIDQVGYDGRINTLERDHEIIEGTTTPHLEEVIIEEEVVDGARVSFKASYVKNTYNAVNDIMEKEEVVELYAISDHAYIMSCRKDIERCKEILSTFRFLD